jgi:hypothetical protein
MFEQYGYPCHIAVNPGCGLFNNKKTAVKTGRASVYSAL